MNDVVLPFPAPDEERARRLRLEIERLVPMSKSEWLFYALDEKHAAKYGVAAPPSGP